MANIHKLFPFDGLQILQNITNHNITLHINLILNMKIILDSDNYVELDPEFGGKIIKLCLSAIVVIETPSPKPSSDMCCGSFLMFPWVSKALINPYQTSQESTFYNLHGLCFGNPRQVTLHWQSHGQVHISMQQKYLNPLRHTFEQKWILKKGSLSMQIEVIENEKDINKYSFGYHPYLQIDQQNLSNITIETDITKMIKFDENTLPIYPFQYADCKLSTSTQYNNLFEGGSFVKLRAKDGRCVRIESQLGYWQIYTHPEEQMIAIEPCSFVGNSYKIWEIQNNNNKAIKQGKITVKALKDD